MLVSLADDWCLAALGICLSTLPFGMLASNGVAVLLSMLEDVDGGVDCCAVIKLADAPIVVDRGGLPEPGHRADKGP